MDISNQIELVKSHLLKIRMENEFNYLKEKSTSDNPHLGQFEGINNDFDLEARIELLKRILKISDKNIKLKSERAGNTVQKQKENMFKEIEKYVFRKQWNKLIAHYKIIKLKEFINENIANVDESEFAMNIFKHLSKFATDGKINTKKYVVYDPNAEKILSIPVLTFDVSKNTYTLKVV